MTFLDESSGPFQKVSCLLSLLWLLLLTAHGAAPQRGLQAITVPDASGQKVELYSASYALVIGVSTYTAGWPSLPGVQEDVQAVQTVLQEQGFQVSTVRNPTKEQLEDAFEHFISLYGGKAEHRLLIYFAGHGHTLRPQYGGNPLGYLVPANAPNPHNDPAGFKRLTLSMQRIEEYALSIEAKHVLFLFDSCFSGSIFSLSRAIPEHISYKTAQPVRQFITSGDENEQVPDKSIFRQQFVAALQGEADTNRDGYITGTELGEFLQSRVVNYAKDAQHPQYGKIRHPKLDKGDFVFQIAAPQHAAPASATPPTPTPLPDTDRQRPANERRALETPRQRLEAARNRTGPPQVTAALPPATPAPEPSALPFFMTRPLTEDDVRGKSLWELEVMRNEIYARHGRRFLRRDLQRYFEQQPWYRGQYAPEAFPPALLSDIQQNNAAFIHNYQKRRP
ncbi:MAG: YARHG domain-containing protein [Candidatus Tectimicrobiota bacterium]